MSKVKVSILCITYNHEKFIRQALESFVMQKTNFPFEVIIHDDASTDGTAAIIKEYADKYPKIIKPIFQTENQWSKGKLPIIHFMLDKVRGKYVAMCEGDDYWTDKNKLQKQVNFLDKNPDFSICFHPVTIKWEDKTNPDSIFPTNDYIFNQDVLSLEDLLQHNFIQTNSVLYRWNLTKEDWPKQNFLPADYLFHLIHAKYGKIKYLNDVMAVYRKHSGGVWDGCGATDAWFMHCGLLHVKFYEILQDMFNIDRSNEIKHLVTRTYQVLLEHKKHEEAKAIYKEYPRICDEVLKAKKRRIIKRVSIFTAIALFCIILCYLAYFFVKGGLL